MKIRLCILYGGVSSEDEVSKLSYENLKKYLNKNKYDIYSLYVDNNRNWIKKIMDLDPNLVISALHGGIGENGAIQGFLECMKIKYIGSKVMSSALCINKTYSKIILKYNNIPVIEGFLLKHNQKFEYYENKIKKLGFPQIIKPNSGGSSIGISIVNNMEQILLALEIAKKYDKDVIFEKYVYGKEITCVVIQRADKIDVVDIIDINKKKMFYDYNEKYEYKDNKSFTNLPKYLKTMITEIAKKCFKVLSCTGYACIDMMIYDEQVYVIELNTLPGITINSILTKTMLKYENYYDFWDKLIEDELSKT